MVHPKAFLFINVLGLSAFVMSVGLGCRMEKGLIFFPERSITQTPADRGIPYEDTTLVTEDAVRINAWFVPSEGSPASLVWLHGNGGNLSHRVDQLHQIRRWIKINILMVDYREYGRSEGSVSEAGTYLDALAAYDYLIQRPDLDPRRIIVFGQSLGAAVAVELATKRSIWGLMLEAPFTSVQDMARSVLPWLPIGGMLQTKYDSLSKIDQIKAPLLILHGDRDEIVPYDQGKRLFDAAPEPKRFFTIVGSGHNDTYVVGGEDYFRAWIHFIDTLPRD